MSLSLTSALVFGVTLAAAAAVPGPSTAATVSRVFSHGLRGARRLCVGLVLGELCWLLCALLGAGALAESHPSLFAAIRYAGVAYLLHLAWRLWRAPTDVAAPYADRGHAGLLLAGLAIALANPKTMLFYLALLPGIVGLDGLRLHDALVLGALASTVVGSVLAAYALSAAHLRHQLRSPVALRRIGRGSALLMAAAAGTIAIR